MTSSPDRGPSPASLSVVGRGRLYLLAVDSQSIALFAALVFLAASLVPWGDYGADLWASGSEIGMLGGLSALVLVVWRGTSLLRPVKSERLTPLCCAAIGTVATVASAYALFLALFAADPPRLIYRQSAYWGEWVMLGATVILGAASVCCWWTHFREWPPRGFRWRAPALLTIGASALVYLILCVTMNWVGLCSVTSTGTSAQTDQSGLERLFGESCVPESYRATTLGELTSFLAILLLLAAVVAAFGLHPIESLALSVTGAFSTGVGALAAFAVIAALATRSTITYHVLLGGWLSLLAAVPLLTAGLSLIRER